MEDTTNAVPTSLTCEYCIKKCGHLLNENFPTGNGENSKRIKKHSDYDRIPEKLEHIADRVIWDRKPIYYEHDESEDYTDLHDEIDNLDIICKFKDSVNDAVYELNASSSEFDVDGPEIGLKHQTTERDHIVWDSLPINNRTSWKIMDFKGEDGEHNCPMPILEESYSKPEKIDKTSNMSMRFHMHATNENKEDQLKMQTNVTKQIDNKMQVNAESINGTNKSRRHNPIVNMDGCGISLNRQIEKGNNATVGQFPWIVRIAYRNISKFQLILN